MYHVNGHLNPSATSYLTWLIWIFYENNPTALKIEGWWIRAGTSQFLLETDKTAMSATRCQEIACYMPQRNNVMRNSNRWIWSNMVVTGVSLACLVSPRMAYILNSILDSWEFMPDSRQISSHGVKLGS